MDSFIERIKTSNFWTFHGGIHPPEQKALTNNKPIRTLPLPETLIIPLQQHIGEAGKLLVSVGDDVLKGQPLTLCTSAMAVPVHAPTSGNVTAIKKSTVAHPSGMQELCLFLAPDGDEKWRPRNICNDYSTLSANTIVEKIIQAGISGMGGAGFPTHIKVNTRKNIETLIINAAECEPYITADDLLIKEHSSAVVDGINILDKLLTPEQILIGIEDNKPDAITALQNATRDNDKVHVCVIPTKYPSGGEKQLIQILTGKEVPKGALPNSIGIVMQNVGTCFAIAEAVIHDIPLIKRVVTVTGFALEKPQNVWALLGTPVGHLLSLAGYKNSDKKHVIMGGPMMGFSLPSPLVPIIKTTNCILAPSEKEISKASYQGDNEVECIRCGECADVCPSQLLPQELQWSAKAKDHNQLNHLNLFDCIECGACAYVCPSQIPLVSYYRIGKAEIRQQNILDLKAEKAKTRFEARKVRLERDKKAREEKQKKAAEARKARMNANTTEAKGEKSAVAAALARVKAKKAQKAQVADSPDVSTPPTEEKQQVSAAIARAKAKKLARENDTKTTTPASSKAPEAKKPEHDEQTSGPEKTAAELKKEKIAAAVAKAKAKKKLNNAKEADAETSNNSTDAGESLGASPQPLAPDEKSKQKTKNADDDTKTRIAAAVEKAKAKKIKQAKEKVRKNTRSLNAEQAEANIDNNTESVVDENVEKSTKSNIDKNEQTSNDSTANDASDKKKRIAAAVAKAKAKKQAQKLAQKQQSESL